MRGFFVSGTRPAHARLVLAGQADPGDVGYLARPPRRTLAIFCIGLCNISEFALTGCQEPQAPDTAVQ